MTPTTINNLARLASIICGALAAFYVADQRMALLFSNLSTGLAMWTVRKAGDSAVVP